MKFVPEKAKIVNGILLMVLAIIIIMILILKESNNLLTKSLMFILIGSILIVGGFFITFLKTLYYEISEEVAEKLNQAKKEGRRIIAVGTTSCRTLEANHSKYGCFKAAHENTNIFIYPGYTFTGIDALITNFHLPKSTLVMLVSALAGREHILNAYKIAVNEKYRFFSFGDAMFIH